MRNYFFLVLSLETPLVLIPRVLLGPGPRQRTLSFWLHMPREEGVERWLHSSLEGQLQSGGSGRLRCHASALQ